MGEKVQMEIHAGGLREIFPLLVQPILRCDALRETIRISDFCLKNVITLQAVQRLIINYLSN